MNINDENTGKLWPNPWFSQACGLRDCLKTRECRVAGDFSSGQDERAAAIPAVGLSRPINAGQREKIRNPSGVSRKGHLAAFSARSKPAEGILPRSCLAIWPFLLTRGIP